MLRMLSARLVSQLLQWNNIKTPAEVVRHFGCMQAQDSNRWKRAIGMRSWTTLEEVHKAIADKKIVRTRPMRGTLHYMAPEYVHMMLDLCASRTLSWFAKRREYLWISDAHAEKALKIMEKSLRGGKILSRSQLGETLQQGWIPMQTQRTYHLACYAATRKLICFWPKDEKEDSFVLLDERLPKPRNMTQDEQLAEVARMYIRSHGPATVDDLARWTGLPKGLCKQAVSLIEKEFEPLAHEGKNYWFSPLKGKEKESSSVHLLWWFDEYFLGYKDRSMVADREHHKKLFTINGIFFPLVMIDGRIVWSWKRVIKKGVVSINCTILGKIHNEHKKQLEKSAQEYALFLWEQKLIISYL